MDKRIAKEIVKFIRKPVYTKEQMEEFDGIAPKGEDFDEFLLDYFEIGYDEIVLLKLLAKTNFDMPKVDAAH